MTPVHLVLYVILAVLCVSISRQIGIELSLKLVLLMFCVATIAVI